LQRFLPGGSRALSLGLSVVTAALAVSGQARAQPRTVVPPQSPEAPADVIEADPGAPAQPVAPRKTLSLGIVPHSREGRPLVWDEDRRRFALSDWFITASGGAISLATAIIKPISHPWKGGILFDEGARDAMRLKDVDARGIARDTSDVLLSISVMGPLLVDAMATAWWYRGSKDVAQQMALIDIETLSVSAAVHGVLAMVSSRERPYVRTCGGELPANSLECNTFDQARSYYSGHTTLTFTSASLVCMHHLNLHLFETASTDVLSCASSMATAGLTGALRIMSDQHYASDVITGAILGTGIGFAVP
jgi:membrane-associated phospholipid phosphatase